LKSRKIIKKRKAIQ